MQRTDYTIGKFRFYQRELTWGEDKQVAALLERAQKELADKTVDLGALFTTLKDTPFLQTLYDIVLKPVWNWRYIIYVTGQALLFPFRKRINWIPVDRFPYTVKEQIAEDFFLHNQQLINKLMNLFRALGLIAASMTNQTPNSNSSKPNSETTTKTQPNEPNAS